MELGVNSAVLKLIGNKCFSIGTTLSNYADDNTFHSIGNTIESVKKALRSDFRITENWFNKNLMVLNAKKYNYMCFRTGSGSDDFIFDGLNHQTVARRKY